MLNVLGGATIQVSNFFNYICHVSRKMAIIRVSCIRFVRFVSLRPINNLSVM